MSAYELFDSRFGTQGITSNSVTTSWLVTAADSVNISTFHPLDDPDLPVTGSGHTAFPGIILKNRQISERLAQRIWKVTLQYSIPETLTGDFGSLWQWTLSGGLESFHSNVTILSRADIVAGRIPVVVGSRVYIPAKQEDATHKIKAASDGQDVLLKQDGEKRRPTGMDITKPVASYMLKRKFHRPVNAEGLLARLNLVNNGPYLGAARHTLKFSTVNVMMVQGDHNLSADGIAFEVQLTFLFNRNGWQHEDYHRWKDDDGNEQIVVSIADDKPVLETYSSYLSTNFSALVTMV